MINGDQHISPRRFHRVTHQYVSEAVAKASAAWVTPTDFTCRLIEAMLSHAAADNAYVEKLQWGLRNARYVILISAFQFSFPSRRRIIAPPARNQLPDAVRPTDGIGLRPFASTSKSHHAIIKNEYKANGEIL